MANIAFSKKVQKNFDSERTVNFPARKLGNFLWPIKNFEKTTRNVGANDNSKTTKSYQNFNEK